MPLVRVSMKTGKPPEYRHAILTNIYQALHETFEVPDEDRFLILSERGIAQFAQG